MGISAQSGLDENRCPPDEPTRRASRTRRSHADGAMRLRQWLLLLDRSHAASRLRRRAGRWRARPRAGARRVRAGPRSRHRAALSPERRPPHRPLPRSHPGRPRSIVVGQTRIAAYQESLGNHRDTPLGVLTIPSVELTAPIFDGTSELALNRGIGQIEGTAVSAPQATSA